MSLSRRDVSSTRTASHHSSIEPRMPPQFDREYAKRLSMARRGRAASSTATSPGRRERASVEGSVLHSGSFTHLPSLRDTVPRLKEFVASHIATGTATATAASGGSAARQRSPSPGHSPEAPPSLAATNPCEPSRLTPTHSPVTLVSTASADLADATLGRLSGVTGGAGLITLVPTLSRSGRAEQPPLQKSPPSGGLTADEAASHCTRVLGTSPSSITTSVAKREGKGTKSSRGAAAAVDEERDDDGGGGSDMNGRTSWLVQQLRGRGLRPEGRWSAVATLLAAIVVIAALLYCVLVPFTSHGVMHEVFDDATTSATMVLGTGKTGDGVTTATTHSTTADLAWLRPYQGWATVHQLHRIRDLAVWAWHAMQPAMYGAGQMTRGLWCGVWGAVRARQRVWHARVSHGYAGRAAMHVLERVTWLPRMVAAQAWAMTHGGVRTVWTTLWTLSTKVLPPDALSGNLSNATKFGDRATQQLETKMTPRAVRTVDKSQSSPQPRSMTADASQLDATLLALRGGEGEGEGRQARLASCKGSATAATRSSDLMHQQTCTLNISRANLEDENRRLRAAHADSVALLSAARGHGNATQTARPVCRRPPEPYANYTAELLACRARLDAASAQRRQYALKETELRRNGESLVVPHTSAAAGHAAGNSHADAACGRREHLVMSTSTRQCDQIVQAVRDASAHQLADAVHAAEQRAEVNCTRRLATALRVQNETEVVRGRTRCGLEVEAARRGAEVVCRESCRDAMTKLATNHVAEFLKLQQLFRERVVEDFSSVCEAAQQTASQPVPGTHCGRYAAELLTELQPTDTPPRDVKEVTATFTRLLDQLHRLWLQEDGSQPHCVLRWSASPATGRPGVVTATSSDATCAQHPHLSVAVSRFSFAMAAVAVMLVLRTYRRQHLRIAQLGLRSASLQAELDALIATATRSGAGPPTLAQASAMLDACHEVLESWYVMSAACLLRHSTLRMHPTCAEDGLPVATPTPTPHKAMSNADALLAANELASLPLTPPLPMPSHNEPSLWASHGETPFVTNLFQCLLAAYFDVLESYHVDLLHAVVHRELAAEVQRGLEVVTARQKAQLQRQSSTVAAIQAELVKQQTEMATLHSTIEAEYGAAQERLTSQLHASETARQTLEATIAERGVELQHISVLAKTQAETIVALEAQLRHLSEVNKGSSATSPLDRRAAERSSPTLSTNHPDGANYVDGVSRHEDGGGDGAVCTTSVHVSANVEAATVPPLSSFITVPSSASRMRLQSPRLGAGASQQHHDAQRIRHYRRLNWDDESDELSG